MLTVTQRRHPLTALGLLAAWHVERLHPARSGMWEDVEVWTWWVECFWHVHFKETPAKREQCPGKTRKTKVRGCFTIYPNSLKQQKALFSKPELIAKSAGFAYRKAVPEEQVVTHAP